MIEYETRVVKLFAVENLFVDCFAAIGRLTILLRIWATLTKSFYGERDWVRTQHLTCSLSI
jgi:hypothetical protein